MDRKLLTVSTVMVLAGLLVMAYSDPAVRAGFGGTTGSTTISFTRSGTFTFTGTPTFPFNGTGTSPINRTNGFPTGGPTGGGAVSTTTQVETFVGLGLVAIGLLIEVFTLFLWEGPADQKGLAQLPGQET